MIPPPHILRRNLVYNFVGAATAAAIPLLALPLYLKVLGAEQWGLVSFVLVVLSMLALADAGASQALVRQFAERRSSVRLEAAMLLRSYEPLYWGIAVTGCLLIVASASLIAGTWLRTGLTEASAERAIQAAGLLFLFQFPSLLYRSALIALQAQGVLNLVLISSALLRHLGGLVLLWRWPSVDTLLVWFIVISFVELGLRGTAAWRTLGLARTSTTPDPALVKATLPEIASMSGAVLLGSLASQSDRIALSGVLTLREFAYYTVASAIAVGVLQLVYPVTQACYPRMVALKHSPDALRKFSLRLFVVFSATVLAGVSGFLCVGRQLLHIWLGDTEVASAVYEPLALLLMGSALNALYNVGYLNWLVHGRSRSIFLVNAFSLCGVVVLVPYCAVTWGVTGAAAGWVLINGLGLLASCGWILPGTKSS